MTLTHPAPSNTTTPPDTGLRGVKPRYTVNGDKDTYFVRVELPGVKKEGVEVKLDQSILTIHAKRTSAPAEGWKTLHRELSDVDYGLRLKLNAPVDDSKMTAKLEDGVLVLALPVRETAKPRRIAID